MAVKYNKQLSKNGAAIGAVVAIVRPDSYPTSAGNSTSPTTEASGWNIATDYPGWLECDGRTLNVSEYRALYAVIGNTYGGTVGSTFKLPDYRSKKICGTGPLNGNKGGSLTLTPTKNATGGTSTGSGSDESGATGGIYTLSAARQLPDGSEITNTTPSNPVTIGGNAVDTFSLGTFRSQGFSSTVVVTEPVLSGNVTFGVGPLKDAIVSGVPPHTHFTQTVRAGNSQASPAPDASSQWAFFEATQANVVSFNRTRRPWPGVVSGFGDFFLFAPVSSLPTGGATLTTGPGTVIRSYGPGTSETNGFSNPGGEGGSQYLAFGSDTGPFVQNRSATFTVNIPAGTDVNTVDTFIIQAIGGNDSNGGERVNSQYDSLKISINGSSPAILLESAYVFWNNGSEAPGGPSPGSFDDYDAEYASWKTFEFTIPEASRTNPLTVTLTQNVNPSGGVGFWDGGPGTELQGAGTTGDPDPPQNLYDSFGISNIGVKSGGGDVYTYNKSTAAVPLQRHSHMLYWNTPNQGDNVPALISTYGTGSGTSNNITVDWSTNPLGITQVAGDGLRGGLSATEVVNTNDSVGDSIEKTLDVVDDISNSVNPSILTLSDSSRTIFDNAIDVRLQAADPITLLTPYFRAKYIIKAF